MVPGDDNLLLVRQGVQPVQLSLNLADGAIIDEIAAMDEQVTAGHVGGVGVGVGDADHADGRLVARRHEGSTPKVEEEQVEVMDNGTQGRVEQLVEQRGRIPWVLAARPGPLPLALQGRLIGHGGTGCLRWRGCVERMLLMSCQLQSWDIYLFPRLDGSVGAVMLIRIYFFSTWEV